MPIGYFSEGKTRYILEARMPDGRCVYRKYTDEDRLNYLFGLIPPTTCGIVFRARFVETDQDKRLHLIAKEDVAAYISQCFNVLRGKISPARLQNEQAVRKFHTRGVVHQQDALGGEPVIPEFAEELPAFPVGTLQPSVDLEKSRKDIGEEYLKETQFPQEEDAPADFDMEQWKSGRHFAIPDSHVLEEPATPEAVPAGASVSGGGFDDQFAVTGEKTPRSERLKNKKG